MDIGFIGLGNVGSKLAGSLLRNGHRLRVPLELSPLCVRIVRDGLERYGPRAWSSMVVKRLEDDCGVDLRAPGFPEFPVDQEPEQPGGEVVVQHRESVE